MELKPGWSGEALLSDSNVPTTNSYFTDPFVICRFQSRQPTPVCLSMGIVSQNNTKLQPADRTFFCGQPELVSIPGYEAAGSGLAMLVIEYGVGSVWRRVIADARPGNYQFPPVQSVRVGVNAYRGNATNWSASMRFSGSIVPGVHNKPSRLTNTFGAYLEGAALSDANPVYVPGSARWFDCWADTGEDLGNADNPILQVSNINTTGPNSYGIPNIQRNYVTGAFTPPFQPVEIDAGVSGNILSAISPVLRMANINTGAPAQACFIRFFLEL